MASFEDVRRIALSLPETAERERHRGLAFWEVRGKGFVWERPLRETDRRALGAGAPDGEILGVRVEHIGIRDALIGEDPDVYFTIPHFEGYPAVLVRLERIDVDELRELIVEAWLLRAPKRVAATWADEHLPPAG